MHKITIEIADNSSHELICIKVNCTERNNYSIENMKEAQLYEQLRAANDL